MNATFKSGDVVCLKSATDQQMTVVKVVGSSVTCTFATNDDAGQRSFKTMDFESVTLALMNSGGANQSTPQSLETGPFTTLLNIDSGKFGFGSTVVGPTDSRGNTIYNQGGFAGGFGAYADPTSVSIGAFAGGKAGGSKNLQAIVSSLNTSFAELARGAVANLSGDELETVKTELSTLVHQVRAILDAKKPTPSVIQNSLAVIRDICSAAGGMATVWSTYGTQLIDGMSALMDSNS